MRLTPRRSRYRPAYLTSASSGLSGSECLRSTCWGFAATARFGLAAARRACIAAAVTSVVTTAATAVAKQSIQQALQRAIAAGCTSWSTSTASRSATGCTEVRSRSNAGRAASRCGCTNLNWNLLADNSRNALGDGVRFANLTALGDLDGLGVALFAALGFANRTWYGTRNHLAHAVGANLGAALRNHLASGVVASLGARLAAVASANRVVAGLGAALRNHLASGVVANFGPLLAVVTAANLVVASLGAALRNHLADGVVANLGFGTREPCGKRCSCKPWCGTREPYGKRCKEPARVRHSRRYLVQVTSFCSQVGTQTFLQIVLGGH